MDQKIDMALKCVGNPVLQLPNKNANVQKYSVLAGDSIEFVNIFQSDSNEGFLICFKTIYLIIFLVIFNCKCIKTVKQLYYCDV